MIEITQYYDERFILVKFRPAKYVVKSVRFGNQVIEVSFSILEAKISNLKIMEETTDIFGIPNFGILRYVNCSHVGVVRYSVP